jgi:hypothetical protein
MTAGRLGIAAAILALTCISFFHFPGRTILQSDTQIYLPMMERLWDSSLFEKDAMATRPHVSFTAYDEAALALRWLTRASFEHVLAGQQFVYRMLGIAGIYLIAAAAGLAPWPAFLVTAIVSLGATISGPAVLTVEYEPVPRGFSLPFVLLSMGCCGWQKWNWSAGAAAIAFLFHPPTALVYCGLLLLVLLQSRRYRQAAILVAGPVLMAVLALIQRPTESAGLFTRLTPALEEMLKMRVSYDWVSLWIGKWWLHYTILALAAFIALRRLRKILPRELQFLFAGLLAAGVLSLPFSFLLLEQLKLYLAPQIQFARYVLFVTLTAVILGSIVAVRAVQQRRYAEGFVFFALVFAVPLEPRIEDLLRSAASNPLVLKHGLLALGLAVLACLAVYFSPRKSGATAVTLAAFLPFLVIPILGEVRNYAPLHHAELDELAAWARTSTPKNALFQFADSGSQLPPGVFRARALRALYADWKAGGQVNFQKAFGELWWERWKKVENPQPLEVYELLGIDYVVFQTPLPDAVPVYQNARYYVYDVRR